MINLSESKIYEFEEFRLDAKNHRLFRRETSELVPLSPKAGELLLFLVENKVRILSKGELLDKVWENSFVEEANLSQTIFVLRKALGENTKEPRFILTAPNRGYQFIASVREIVAGDEILEDSILTGGRSSEILNTKLQSQNILHQKVDSRIPKSIWLIFPVAFIFLLGIYWLYPVSKPYALHEIKTIAVLPFEDLSEGETDKYLGVSLADALVNKFSGLKAIIVRPTRAVLKYQEKREDLRKIGRELQVDAVLDGRIQRIGERVRVSVQLVRTSDNATVWSGNFDEQFTNFFALQDSISQKVVQSIALRVDENDRQKFNRRATENAEAYQEYLLGRFFWNKRSAKDLDRAIEHFKRAIDLDENFSLAYSGLAETYAIYQFYAVDSDKESLPKARVSAIRALEIDEELAEAYTVLAYVQSQYDRNWEGAEKTYLRAIELNPNDATARQWYGEFLAFHSRTEESLNQMRKAIELDPTSLSTNTAPALAYNASKQFEKALETADKVLEMDANFLIARHYKARALFFSGKQAEALEYYRKIIADSDGNIFFTADFGCLTGIAGNELEARAILTKLHETAKVRYVSPFHFAYLHIGLNEREKAFEYLRKAVAERDNNVITLKVGLNFDSIRSDPQFVEILRSANFQQ